eukprot:1374622-Amorphochlora_amoeboformis.AAC.1
MYHVPLAIRIRRVMCTEPRSRIAGRGARGTTGVNHGRPPMKFLFLPASYTCTGRVWAKAWILVHLQVRGLRIWIL